MNLTEYDISHPYEATVVKSERITPEISPEVRHIVLNIPDATFHYLEGQSIGVLVPGPHAFGNAIHFRLYSIANSRQGEDHKMTEISLCVRRCFYIDSVSGERFPGVASNFLCDRKPGEVVQISGPYGRQFLPPRDKTCNILMIGVGTGIAPFRAFIKHIYEEEKDWEGQVRLFYGAKTGMELLYLNNENKDLSHYYDRDTFKAFESLSPRPHVDAPEEIDRTLLENKEDVWSLIEDKKTHVYVSGLSGMEGTLDKALASMAGSEEDWLKRKSEMIAEGRWSTLFYE